MDGNLNFYSVSADGRVVVWKIVKVCSHAYMYMYMYVQVLRTHAPQLILYVHVHMYIIHV